MLTVLQGDCLEKLRELPDASVQCCVTSPPYWGLRDYGTAKWEGGDVQCDHSTPRSRGDDIKPHDKQGTSAGSRPNTQVSCKCGAIRVDAQLGLEKTPEEYVAKMVAVFREVRRVLKDDGTSWLNLGDSYAGSCQTGGTNSISGNGKSQPHAIHKRDTGLKPKDLVGIPWMVAFALRSDGWYLRQWMPWVKRNPMPESTRDRPTSACEVFFLVTKSQTYFYDHAAVQRRMAESSLPRLNQDLVQQAGSVRANGGAKSNGAMKAVRGSDKQRGHSRRHQGFNDCWDAMDKTEQCETRAYRNSDMFFASLGGPFGAIANETGIIAFDVATQPFRDAHFATYPPDLIKPCILAGTRTGDVCARSVWRERDDWNGRTGAWT